MKPVVVWWTVLVLAIALASGEQNHYSVLGVSREASTSDIRRAYKKLAVKYHPDKNKDDPKANEKFMKIAHAHEVLSDDSTRREYDHQVRYGGGGGGGGGHRGRQRQRHRGGGFYTFTTRNGRTYYEYHAGGGQYSEGQNVGHVSATMIVAIMVLLFVSTFLPEFRNGGTSQEPPSSKRKHTGIGLSPIADGARYSPLTKRISNIMVKHQKRPYTIVFLFRKVHSPGYNLREDTMIKLWRRIEATARKFTTDPIVFGYVMDTFGEVRGDEANATRAYSAWVKALLGDFNGELCERVQAQVESPDFAFPPSHVLERASDRSWVDTDVVVDAICVVNFKRARVRVYDGLEEHYGMRGSLLHLSEQLKRELVENWVTKILGGEVSVPRVAMENDRWPSFM